MGYGKVLIEFSYELSKVEKKAGSPEKPLSDLGLLSYRSYWADILLEKLIDYQGEITISELADLTSFTTDDILSTLQHMDVIRYFKGQFVLCLSDSHIEQYEKLKKKSRIRIEPTKLEWTPPKFAPNQLRYI
jgi:histone acetyltransferase HTATIP